jgi:hypothetical protein
MDNQSNFSMQDAMRLAATPAGQQLIALLRQQGGNELQHALNSAAAGDYTKAKQSLEALMTDPQAQKLLEQLMR